MRGFGPMSLLALLALLFLLPLLFGELMVASLAKLNLSPSTALGLVVAMLVGGAINIPVKRLDTPGGKPAHPLAAYRLENLWPQLWQARRVSVVAVNVGGCLIPLLIVAYEVSVLAETNPGALVIAAIASALNTWVCYRVARPVPRVGIMMPALVSPLVSAFLALILAPEVSAPVAFITGVLGPLIGADLLHLREFERSGAAIVSIGGAGTFDGIVLSGIIAAYLA
ncbi:MAG: DUF1614 domain-containing protein [Gemmatimonas sp.]